MKSFREVSAAVRDGWRWGAGAAAAAVVAAMVSWLSRQPPPIPPIVPAPAPPWSTHLAGRIVGGHAAWTITMTNKERHALMVRPLTHPFRLVFTSMVSAEKPVSWVEAFPKGLRIPVNESRQFTVFTPTPRSGWYDVTTTTVSVYPTHGGTRDQTNAVGAEFFVPFPPGTMRSGSVTLNQSQTSDGYTVTARRLAMTQRMTTFTFDITRVPLFPTNISARVDAGGHPIGGWGLSQRSVSGRAVTRNAGVRATVLADPVPKSAHMVTITLSNLGTKPSGKPRALGPWVFHIPLPPPS